MQGHPYRLHLLRPDAVLNGDDLLVRVILPGRSHETGDCNPSSVQVPRRGCLRSRSAPCALAALQGRERAAAAKNHKTAGAKEHPLHPADPSNSSLPRQQPLHMPKHVCRLEPAGASESDARQASKQVSSSRNCRDWPPEYGFCLGESEVVVRGLLP